MTGRPSRPSPADRPRLALERLGGDWARRHLPTAAFEFLLFGLKQGWACLFAGLMLALIIGTKLVWQPGWPIHRYDALLVAAIVIQSAFLLFRLETLNEAKVILVFHVVGTMMEIFKVAMGSWAYPEAGLAKIMGVPLFSGFMYACVGSYIARVIRIFDMRFEPYPPLWTTVVLCALIYGNFFWHHFAVDIRYALFALTVVLFWRTRIYFRIDKDYRWMPLLLAAFLSAGFVFLAENIGTATGTWLYAGQTPFQMVSLGKFGSWYLLMFISFVLVTLVNPPKGLYAKC
jgi:uncharacterized membrane protein YoaT (DUF817 family)